MMKLDEKIKNKTERTFLTACFIKYQKKKEVQTMYKFIYDQSRGDSYEFILKML
jgi:hypothetical protein